MSDIVTDLMQANLLAVFNERDPQTRADAIAATYADEVRWTDDEGLVTGHDALNDKAAQLQAGLTGMHFTAAGTVRQTRGFGFLAWEVRRDEDDVAVMTGFDVALIADERITDLWTVLTGPPSE
ncbi:nuclear transport factor 2 family protein [Arthrobacter sp. SLBN-53]|uniref:nuclear transport factor 2 family protein n=1 Tax=Arthrobacter sp. SLBN-53 TaxID=2768412 RepID=UPI00116DE9D3|nr:nuclear transport factor 2 family protein [Arthrobacter sp. SLBN-53]TQK31281.1 SnoaL-like protein [Arthrobacter sp. SLBN-53]